MLHVHGKYVYSTLYSIREKREILKEETACVFNATCTYIYVYITAYSFLKAVSSFTISHFPLMLYTCSVLYTYFPCTCICVHVHVQYVPQCTLFPCTCMCVHVQYVPQCTLFQAGVDFLRLGSKHTVHPSLHPYLPCQTPCSTVSDLDTLYQATVQYIMLHVYLSMFYNTCTCIPDKLCIFPADES